MNQCIHCGRENSDEVLQCDCVGGATALSPALSLTPSRSAASDTGAWKDQQLLTFELLLVCVIAFGSSVLTCVETLFSTEVSAGGRASHREFSIVHQVGALMLVWFLLRRRSKSFSDLGLAWSWVDVGWSMLLYFGANIAFLGFYWPLAAVAEGAGLDGTGANWVKQLLPMEGGVPAIFLIFVFINPFFEELIVRAYVMTVVKQITRSAIILPILVSTALQTSYHLYQGAPRALAHGASFFVFSVYYAKTNRIAPVILAHLFMDIWAVTAIWLRVH